MLILGWISLISWRRLSRTQMCWLVSSQGTWLKAMENWTQTTSRSTSSHNPQIKWDHLQVKPKRSQANGPTSNPFWVQQIKLQNSLIIILKIAKSPWALKLIISIMDQMDGEKRQIIPGISPKIKRERLRMISMMWMTSLMIMMI